MLTVIALAYIAISIVIVFASLRAKNRSVDGDLRVGEDIEQMRALFLASRSGSRRVSTSTRVRATHDSI